MAASLHQVIQVGAGAVGIDVIHRLRERLASDKANSMALAVPFPSGSGLVMVGVGGGAIAHPLLRKF